MQADWQRQGLLDGRDGHAETRFDEHLKACAGTSAVPDKAAWLAGRQRGLTVYCSGPGGVRAGLNGRPYRNVCPTDQATAFHRGYAAASQVRYYEGRLDAHQQAQEEERKKSRAANQGYALNGFISANSVLIAEDKAALTAAQGELQALDGDGRLFTRPLPAELRDNWLRTEVLVLPDGGKAGQLKGSAMPWETRREPRRQSLEEVVAELILDGVAASAIWLADELTHSSREQALAPLRLHLSTLDLDAAMLGTADQALGKVAWMHAAPARLAADAASLPAGRDADAVLVLNASRHFHKDLSGFVMSVQADLLANTPALQELSALWYGKAAQGLLPSGNPLHGETVSINFSLPGKPSSRDERAALWLADDARRLRQALDEGQKLALFAIAEKLQRFPDDSSPLGEPAILAFGGRVHRVLPGFPFRAQEAPAYADWLGYRGKRQIFITLE